MTFTLTHIDHIPLAAPRIQKAKHDTFRNRSWLNRSQKPESLKKRGGVWFVNLVLISCILVLKLPFHPPKKAHPGFHVKNLPAFKDHLTSFGISFYRRQKHSRCRKNLCG